MAEFEELRDQLAGRRRQREDKRREALLAHEAVRRGERALEEFARAETPEQKRERTRLEERLRGARRRAEAAVADLEWLSVDEQRLLEAFQAFSDPREGLRRWSDRHPILLFPLRLETRFKSGPNGQPQLWVRVFPDTCLVDAFEPTLAEREIDSAQAFWARVWRAGGDEALERAAWRELVAAHGAGRAGWIVRRYLPLNPGDKPVKDNATDVLLIVTAPHPLPPAAALYWQAAWRAEGDAAAQQAAYAALEAALGPDQARRVAQQRPFNFDDAPQPPRTRAGVQVKVAGLRLTPQDELETRRTSWSSAPRVELLPERFVLVAWSAGATTPLTAVGNLVRTPLVAGPDPNAPPDEQLQPVDDTLKIPDQLAWMFDFERALQVGMALRVDLTPQQARDGFARVLVLGLRLRDSPDEGREHLETLLEHHLHSRPGLAIVPQGTPTNNTEQGGSGWSFRDDPDATFDPFFRQTPQYALESDPLARRDGQWLAELVGLRHDLVQRIPHAGGRDQSEARAMQIALWPGTLGYMMKTLLAPVFSEEDVAATRAFFTRFVSGRGPLPALRIDDQPYGILPATAFKRIDWFGGDATAARLPFAGRLQRILERIDDDWRPLVERVSFVGKRGGDPHQVLLDVLGLHPSSVEYHPLQGESVEHKFYELAFLDFSIALRFLDLFPAILPLTLLRGFGYTGEEVPDLLRRIYKARQTPLGGPVVDDRPLSESEPIRAYAGGRNYIEWLVDAARTGIQAIQEEQGFDDGQKPLALLYLLLRHALQLGLHETGLRLKLRAGVVASAAPLLREAAFVHVAEQAAESESRYDLLFRPDERVTHHPRVALGDHIARNLKAVDPELREQVEALERLARVPTARLERVFAEHLDACSYRLDAWKTGLVAWQLEHLRRPPKRGEAPSPGLFLGAFGWIEPLRPEPKVLTPVELPEDLAAEVNRRDTAPLLRDSANLGLIHAPSLGHATTAAVLRNGYVANDGRLAVNLTSRRVQLALGILEGLRGGQSLGALLGYGFERHVHDHGPLQVRALVYPLRRAFPLVANRIRKTRDEDGAARESIAAMNVVDGRKLVEHIERTGHAAYPFGVAALPRGDAAEEAALTAAAAHIRDLNDAVADLVLAEGVHQAVSGNFERSAGTLDAFAKGSYPPEPEVVRTPRSGIALTLRVGLHLSPTPPANPLPAIALTPLASAEPALNAWLAGRLPAPEDVGCQVSFTDRATGAPQTVFVNQAQLGLQAIDVVYRAEAGAERQLRDLDDRILRHLHAHHAPRHDREIRIRYTERVPARVSWFELQPLVRSLRALVSASRPLAPADLVRAGDAARDEQAAVSLPRSRVADRRDDLQNVQLPALGALAATLAAPATSVDGAVDAFAATLEPLAACRLPQAGAGFAFEWRAERYAALVAKVVERLGLWDERLARFDRLIADYDALPPATPEEQRLPELRAAELVVRTTLTDPPPAGAAAYRALLDTRRGEFVARRGDLQQIVDVPRATLTALLDDARAELPLAPFDPADLDFTEDEQEITRFRTRLTTAVAALEEEVTRRVARADALLTQHDTAGPADKVKRLQEAATTLLGDDFQMVPQVVLPAAAADELANAWRHSTSGDLTRHLTDGGARDFPVDDWLHGLARVREKLHDWETVLLHGEALGAARLATLTPLQLPYRAGEPWLGLEFPDAHAIEGDRLLYTAHFAEPFDQTRPVCGLLLDEWTEVIPGRDETTGIAFHYDRPNSEPPQVWLLCLPAVRDGAWSWDELVEAVVDAFESAKRRALEPVHLDTTAYSWFLPASVSAYTFPEISISNNLLRNVQIYSRLAEE